VRAYFSKDGITIYLGDCREILPSLPKVDLVLTDPPYGIGEHGGKCRTRGAPGYSKHADLGWDTAPPDAATIALVLSMAPDAVLWGGNYFANNLPPIYAVRFA